MNRFTRSISRLCSYVSLSDYKYIPTNPKFVIGYATKFAVITSICYIWLVLLDRAFPQALFPFSLNDIWESKGNLVDWLTLGLPLFLWGIAIASVNAAIFTCYSASQNARAGQHFFWGLCISVVAGFFEEILYRWIYFYLLIISVKLSNFCFLGFIGLPIIKWLHVYISGPIFNLLTFGQLKTWLVNPDIWFVGSALLVVNAKFRDGHAYQGIWGLLNSWVLGFFLFRVALSHGLLAAIVVHFFYDALIFTIESVDRLVGLLREKTK